MTHAYVRELMGNQLIQIGVLLLVFVPILAFIAWPLIFSKDKDDERP